VRAVGPGPVGAACPNPPSGKAKRPATMSCERHANCSGPAEQGIVSTWDQTGSATGAVTPESFAQGSFAYRGGSGGKDVADRVVVGAQAVEVRPSCAYIPASAGSASLRLELRNMCPELRTDGRPCTQAGTCRFEAGTCAQTSARAYDPASAATARCVYDLNLLRTPADVSYLLRSSAGGGTSQFPARAAAALMDDWTARMREAERSGTPVTSASKANAWCLAAQNATLGNVQPAPNDDYRNVSDAFGDSWGPIFYGQVDWLAAVLGRPTSDAAGVAGDRCIVTQNCTVSTQWCGKYYGSA
jgi:hypothetical protein